MKKGITEKKKSKKYKLWYRILAYVGVILILFTACSLPISAVIDVSRGEGDDYNITANSSFPMDIGFTYRSSPNSTYNYTLMTSLGGFGQEWNRTSYGEDVVFYMYDELGNAVEVERGIAYTYGDVEWTTEEAFIGHMMGNRLGYQPINIGSTTPSSTDEQPVTTIVLKASDIVYNTAWTDWYRITRDSLNPPTLEELAYMGIPTIASPHVIDPSSERFIGRLNINYDIVDCYGNVKNSNYSVEIDTQLRDDPIPLISVDDLLAYDIPLNPRLLISNFSAWWDVDYYTKSVGPTAVVPGGIYVANESFTLSPLERYNINFTSNGESFNYVYATSSSIIYGKVDSSGNTSEVTAYDSQGWRSNYSTIEFPYNYTVYQAFAQWGLSVFEPYVAPPPDVDSSMIRGCWRLRPDITSEELQNFVSLYGEQSFPVAKVAAVTIIGNSIQGIQVFSLSYARFVLKLATETDNAWSNLQLGIYAPGSLGASGDRYISQGYGDYVGVDSGTFAVQVVEGPNDSTRYAKKFIPPFSSGSSYWNYYNSARSLCFNSSTDATLLNMLQAFAFKWSDSVNDFTYDNVIKNDDELLTSSASAVATTDYTDSSTISSNPSFSTWQKDYDSRKNYVNLTIPLYDTSGAIMSDEAAVSAQIIYWSFPTAFSYARNLEYISFDDLSWTDWLVNGIGGFLNFEIVPNLSFGGLLGILVTFSVVLIFLKIFAGG